MSQDRTPQESQYRLSVSFIGFYESYLSAYRHRTILAYRSDSNYSKCLLLALTYALKQSRRWSVKLCWLLTTVQWDAISAYWHTSLVSDKHVPAGQFQLVSPGCALLLWFSCNHGWKCILLWCLPVHHMCARAPSCCGKRLTPDLWPLNRPYFSPVDCRVWTVVQECFYHKRQGMSNIVNELWL